MSTITFYRPKLRNLFKIKSDSTFHDFYFEEAMDLYKKSLKNKKDFGTVLSLGSSYNEAQHLTKFPFKKIVLSGIMPLSKQIKEVIKKDNRVSYTYANIEKLPFKSQNFDLVFVKESLHHVPRPIIGLYEMLRVCKNATIFIEPKESLFGKFLDKLNLSSRYEHIKTENQNSRSNYVYRWDENEITKLLNSYYLESDYNVHFESFWLSSRINAKIPVFTKFLSFMGFLISFIPYNRGNSLLCMIQPGKDLPSEIN